MHTKTIADGTIYEYDDQSLAHSDGTSGYGHLIKETRPDSSYKTFSDYFDADHAKTVKTFSSSGILIATYTYDASGVLLNTVESGVTYTYYASGRMHTKTLLVADGALAIGTILEYDDTATIENRSEHPLAQAIVGEARLQHLTPAPL